jgi:Na+-transporting methylmalonyl-CoA/oxaloacetate decarboxylase gamma subunit
MVETLEAGGKTTEEQLLVLKSDLNTIIVEQEEAKRNNPLNAFFAFNESTNGLAIGSGLVFVLLIIVAIVLRNSGDSIYSGFSLPKFENPFKKEESGLGGEVQESTESKEDDIDEQADEMFRGKWAFIDEEDKK